MQLILSVITSKPYSKFLVKGTDTICTKNKDLNVGLNLTPGAKFAQRTFVIDVCVRSSYTSHKK